MTSELFRQKLASAQAHHSAAIEGELASLLASGISKDRIALEQHPGPRTIVTVDGWPVSAFTVGFFDSSASPTPKPGDKIILK